MSALAGIKREFRPTHLIRRLNRWMEAMAHPLLAIEIGFDRIAGARWTRDGHIDKFLIQPLPPGSLVPSPVELNVVNNAAISSALSEVCSALQAENEEVALLLPDPVIRVFVQHFDDFPRSPQEALPMLRWRLKKSVPFAADEMLVSYMRQSSPQQGVDIVAAIARQKIVGEYDALTQALNLRAGVVLTSSISAISLLQTDKPTLMARISDNTLTTTIVRDGVLCGYRCTELSCNAETLTPASLLDEIYPFAAYYQDLWQQGIQSVAIAGLTGRLAEFVGPLASEFHCEVQALLYSALLAARVPEEARPLVEQELDGLVGWMAQHD